MTDLLGTSLIIYMINIPFGYWRAGTKRFSLQWYLAIHIPVPAIVFLRVYLNLGWTWETYTIFILAFFLGQLTGKVFRRVLSKT
jgi:hypothetical protein